MKKNVAKGKIGEDIASEFLEKKGLIILERNWRYSRIGELDIIAFDGEILTFIEVKARKSTKFGDPIEAVTRAKMAKICSLAELYVNNNLHLKFKSIRYDVIGILLNNVASKEPEITYYKDVYQF